MNCTVALTPKGISHVFLAISDCTLVVLLTKKWDDCETPIVHEDMGIWGDYWSSTVQDWGSWVRNFAYYNSASHRQICDKHYGMAIRCVSDNYILGDINGDEVLNVLDIVLMINMILSDEYSVVADVNEDESVDVLDVVLMVNILVGGLPQSN